ncbi:MAG TPA: HlyD family efflux transporter periplasmic adaptor subunit [Gemmatales bacterium]|nr:HlyD family efflux transporter periplasmic adaptor subunit [Gemmatales bacterium]HMP58652.1 HlyD family efflux transporter periplasmic adaptor subunit [Gemmatales bacterium]
MWRFLVFVALLVGLIGAAWYLKGTPELSSTPRVDNPLAPTRVATPLSVGGASASVAPLGVGEASASTGLKDPVHVPGATLFPKAEQDVASRTDGQVQSVHVRLGDRVVAGQTLARLDESLAQAIVESARIEAESEATLSSADEQERATRQIYEKDRMAGAGVSEVDKLIHFFQWKKAQADVVKAREERDVARQRLVKARRELELHTLRTEIDGEISLATKKVGDPVRGGETIFHVINTDHVWAEGFVEAEHAAQLRPGMRVLVEPERPEAPLKELRRHTGPVLDLATSPDSVLLASASEDGTVIVWDWRAGVPVWVGRTEPRQVEFYSVAFSPVAKDGANGRTYDLAVGGGDGVVRLWTLRLDASRRVHVEASHELRSPHHSGRIFAVTFAPNGQVLASGGADRNIVLWKLEDREALYRFPTNDSRETAHRGAVTSLLFTPTGELISTSTDRTVKCWELDQSFAVLRLQLEGRSGDVFRFNLSPDGNQILFEKDEELRIVDLRDGGIVGVMKSRDGLFRNLALFAPQGNQVLTSTANGRLQLWRAPAAPNEERFFRTAYQQRVRKNSFVLLGLMGEVLNPGLPVVSGVYAVVASPQLRSAPLPDLALAPAFPTMAASAALPTVEVVERPFEGLTAIPTLWPLGGYELRHLRCPETAGVFCGTFALHAPVAFTAGRDHVIRVWPRPADVDRTIEGVLTYVGSQVQSGTTLTRIRAEFTNPRDSRRLKIGGKVSLTLYPETAD